MRAKSLLPLMAAAAVLAVAIASAATGGGFDLLTPKEYSIELHDRTLPGAAFVPRAADLNAPTITVMTPDSHAPIKPPVDIDLRFKPAEGATVNAGSLKILYGFMHLDITQRILQAPGVQVSAAGLTAKGARLPSGSHKLTIEVRDNLGRAGRQVLEFVVQ
ncbi:MAG TPA: hypothetical protein VNX02_07095 [Steroidobacteraceae bacterium]|jgi:hypothetical protein|nr:hypothetical protein [Steroidobacteraceae bacterium]